MNVIILFALILVIISLANKYLKVPRDNNQRYDGINNRFYGEGYTGDVPVPPAGDEDQEGGPEDLQGEQDEEAEDSVGSGDDVNETGDQEEYEPDEAGEECEPAETDMGNEQGVVIDTEVLIDAPMPQEPGKS